MTYDPTPIEIAEACSEIQSHWDEREYDRRAGLIESQTVRWLPPGPVRTQILDRDKFHFLRTKALNDSFN